MGSRSVSSVRERRISCGCGASRPSKTAAWPCSRSSGRTTNSGCWRSTTIGVQPKCDAISTGWTRPRRSDYLQTTVQEPWGATRDHRSPRETVGSVPSKPVEEPDRLGSALLTQQVTLEPVRPRICAFCKTENSRNHQRADEVCRGCGGPLTRLIDVAAGHANRRTARRIEHQTNIHYRVDSSRPGTTSGQMVDLSPTGLRFLSRRRLIPGHVIKIDSATLSAVATVTRSVPENTTGFFSTGVRFLTLRLGRPQGTFVSECA